MNKVERHDVFETCALLARRAVLERFGALVAPDLQADAGFVAGASEIASANEGNNGFFSVIVLADDGREELDFIVFFETAARHDFTGYIENEGHLLILYFCGT